MKHRTPTTTASQEKRDTYRSTTDATKHNTSKPQSSRMTSVVSAPVRSTGAGLQPLVMSNKPAIRSSNISPQYTVTPPSQQAVKRKTSVSELLGRLTGPNSGTQQPKARIPTRSVSGSSAVKTRSTVSSTGRRAVSGSEVPISRPIPLPKTQSPTLRTYNTHSPDVQLASRKKAPSPPRAPETRSVEHKTLDPKAQAPQGIRVVTNFQKVNRNQSADSSTESLASTLKSYRTPRMESIQQFQSPVTSPTSVQSAPLQSTRKVTKSSASTSSTRSGSTGSKSSGNTLSPKMLLDSADAPQTPTEPSQQSINLTQDLRKTPQSQLGHQRRLSAPAPGLNITTPRAMSQAGGNMHKQRIASPPISPASAGSVSTQHRKTSSMFSTSLTSSPEEGFTDVKPLTPRLPSESPVMETSSDEQRNLFELNKNLNATNKLLKQRLEELMSSQEQTLNNLSVSEASRNSLMQQVKGYESLQRGMEKKLEEADKKLAISQKNVLKLKGHIQELKISLEEKHFENYKLIRDFNRVTNDPEYRS